MIFDALDIESKRNHVIYIYYTHSITQQLSRFSRFRLVASSV